MAKLAASMPNPALPKPNADSSGHVDLEALLKIQPNWVEEAVARAKMGPVAVPEPPPPISLAPPSLHPIAMDDIPLGVPKNGMAIAAASGAAFVLVGAALFFAWKTHATGAQLAVAPKPAPVAVAAARADTLIPPPPPVAPVQTTPAAQPAVADNAAPVAAGNDDAQEAPAAPTAGGHSKHVHHKGHHAELEPAAAPAPAPLAAAPAAHKGPPPKANSALDAALSQAAGPGPALPAPAPVAAPPPAAAAPSAGDRPDRPSGSAVKDALMSILGAAKSCVSGESDASHVHVTWGSSGAMKSIDITGPAQSDPHAKLCLNHAFARAHVPAFADPTYAANVTIRP